MKAQLLGLFFCFALSVLPTLAQEQQVVVPYTLADRDRAILTETKINALENNINIRFESQQRQLDDIKTLFYWGFVVLITLFIFMFGYMIWDRLETGKLGDRKTRGRKCPLQLFVVILNS